jgi:hypothetical protein
MTHTEHFNSCYPYEAAGYYKDGIFHPLDNISDGDRRNEVAVDPSFLLDDPDVFVHSHTTGWRQLEAGEDPRSPSYFDLKGQIETDIEWAVCTTDGENCSELLYWGNPNHRPELEGRDFIFNIQDCLSLAQDWFYKEHKLVLPNQPRHPFWHEDGANHIEDLYHLWGFEDIELSQMKKGDVLLYAIKYPMARHIGVYLGNNQVLSHWHDRLSAVEPFGKWAKYVKLAARHKDLNK